MTQVVQAPVELVEEVAGLRFPPAMDARLQDLMNRNTEGALSPQEKRDLESLVEMSEVLALLRAKALRVLDRKPR